MLSAVVGVVMTGEFIGGGGVKEGGAGARVELKLSDVKWGVVVATIVGIGAIIPQAANRITPRIKVVAIPLFTTIELDIQVNLL